MDGWLSSTTRRNMGEEVSYITRSCHFSFLGDSLHSAYWEIWDNHSHLISIVVNDRSYQNILLSKVFQPGEITDIGHIFLLYNIFDIMKEKIRCAIREFLIAESSFPEMSGVLFYQCICEIIKSWMCDNSFHKYNINKINYNATRFLLGSYKGFYEQAVRGGMVHPVR